MLEQIEFCRICGGKYPAGQLSNRGICGHCGRQLLLDAIEQLQSKSGPVYEKWRTAYIASMQATIHRLQQEVSKNG